MKLKSNASSPASSASLGEARRGGGGRPREGMARLAVIPALFFVLLAAATTGASRSRVPSRATPSRSRATRITRHRDERTPSPLRLSAPPRPSLVTCLPSLPQAAPARATPIPTASATRSRSIRRRTRRRRRPRPPATTPPRRRGTEEMIRTTISTRSTSRRAARSRRRRRTPSRSTSPARAPQARWRSRRRGTT